MNRTVENQMAGGGESAVLGVDISHPDKVLWPGAQPVTKLDLALYYQAVADWMMPHIKGRPCSVIRAPDGIDGVRFFQRHATTGASKLFSFTQVAGDEDPFLQIDRPVALIAAAQIAAVELHPWNSAPGRPDTPGRLVFDIDPAPDIGFDAVLEAARDLHSLLRSVGLVPYCKTTGGKGLHVVTPLDAPEHDGPDWAAAKGFARDICARLAAERPDRYLVEIAKAKRNGRIFLDYLRNDRMATAVAPLSPRARPSAPVSMPLAWPQVRQGLDPQRFTVRSAPALIAKSGAWADYGQGKRPLSEAMARLTRL